MILSQRLSEVDVLLVFRISFRVLSPPRIKGYESLFSLVSWRVEL